MKTPNIYWIDLFCGAGGTSTGIHLAGEKVIICINHDPNAIHSHKQNHPETIHFTEDIKNFNVIEKVRQFVINLRDKEPDCIINLWASLECTNFSKAKGGQPKDADSRSLAEHMKYYIEAIIPNYFYVENVREFLSWGPLDDKGKPISRLNGEDYLRWETMIKSYGYDSKWRLLNSADYGSYQKRERLFIIFSEKQMPVQWPEQTHAEDGSENDLFSIKKWNPVKSVLDLEDEGNSIFTRKKQLVDRTLEVIYKGIIKALKENESVFLYKYYGNGTNYNSINTPSGTITTKDRFAKIQLIFNQYKTGNTTSIEKPSTSITTVPKQNLLTFILNPSYGGHTSSIEKPSPTIIARQDKAPLYLITTLMQEQNIVDIKMRMLKIPELLKIQGFPENYNLIGTQTEQKKFIGNAVEVNMAKALIKANTSAIKNWFKSNLKTA